MQWHSRGTHVLPLLLCVPMNTMIYQREPLNAATVKYEDQAPMAHFDFELHDTYVLCDASLLKLERSSYLDVFQANRPNCWESLVDTEGKVPPWYELVHALPPQFDAEAAHAMLSDLIRIIQQNEPLSCETQAAILSIMRRHPTCSPFEIAAGTFEMPAYPHADLEPEDDSFKVDYVSPDYLSAPKPAPASLGPDLASFKYFGTVASAPVFKTTSHADSAPACPATVEPSSSSTGEMFVSLTAM